jgi:hypothetical protein
MCKVRSIPARLSRYDGDAEEKFRSVIIGIFKFLISVAASESG